jgi:RimJ/RimL family protein N-acetyltransferase
MNYPELKKEKGETIQIRKADVGDAEAMNGFVQDIFTSSEYLLTSPREFRALSLEQRKQSIEKYSATGVIFLAFDKGELVGMIDFQAGARSRTSHKGVFGMSVRSSSRGQGVGKLLLGALIHWVSSHPTIEVINLEVIEANIPAVQLYKKMGFEIVGREPYGIRLDDGELTANLIMSMRVKSENGTTDQN